MTAGGRLGTAGGRGGAAGTTYRYDPRDPTPGLGGAMLSTGAGSVDNTPLEARDDVVTFTSAALPAPLEVAGQPCARLRVSATSPHFDLVVRLCVVRPDGRSLNLADGHVRLGGAAGEVHRDDLAAGTPAGGDPAAGDGEVLSVDVPLSPLAHRFHPGERVRLQVASGAHPRIARNLGTGESALQGTSMRAVDVTVHHSPGQPSVLELPVWRTGPRGGAA